MGEYYRCDCDYERYEEDPLRWYDWLMLWVIALTFGVLPFCIIGGIILIVDLLI